MKWFDGAHHLRQGFTLVEIMVVISLMAILAGTGIAGYRNSARKQAVEVAAQKLISALRKAQVNAAAGVKEGCAGTLTGWQVNVSANSYTIEGLCGVTTFNSRTENYTGASVTVFPSPNPILFKVLNQGTNIIGSTTVTLGVTGISYTRNVKVLWTGQIE